MKEIEKKHTSSIRSFSRGIMKMLPGSLAGQFILISISPIVTRLYSPSDFGIYAFYSNLFGIIAVMASFRIEMLIPTSKNGRIASDLTYLGLISSAVLGVLSAFISLAVYLSLAADIQFRELMLWVWVVPISVFLFGASNVLTAWALFFGLHARMGGLRFVQGVQSAGVQLAYPFFAPGAGGLVLGAVLGQVGGFIGVGASYATRLKRSKPTLAASWQLFLERRALIFWNVCASVVARVAVHAPLPLFFVFVSPEVAGLLMLCQRVVGVPTLIFGRVLASNYQQALGKAHRGGRSATSILIVLLLSLAFLGLLSLTPIFVFGPQAFPYVFGSEWSEAGEISRILLPMFFFQLLATPVAQSMVVTKRGSVQLVLETARLLIIILSILAPISFGAPLYWTIVSYSAASSIVYIVYIIFAFHGARDTPRNVSIGA